MNVSSIQSTTTLCSIQNNFYAVPKMYCVLWGALCTSEIFKGIPRGVTCSNPGSEIEMVQSEISLFSKLFLNFYKKMLIAGLSV